MAYCRKMLSVMLTLVMLAGFFTVTPVSADETQLAETGYYTKEDEEYPGLRYAVYSDAAVVVRYTGSDMQVVIPSEVDGVPVTVIEEGAFKNCTTVKSVTIPDTVIWLDMNVFSGCTALQSVNIPEAVTRLLSGLFSGCTALSEIVIPDSVTEITDNAFSGCTGLRNIRLPASLREINNSFQNCTALESIEIPASVYSISPDAFTTCDSIREYTVSEDNEYFTAVDGVLYTKDRKKLISFPQSKVGGGEIPYGVTAIGEKAFYRAITLTEITIPETVTTIGDEAFNFCVYLDEISVPDSVVNIGKSVFDNTGWYYHHPEGVMYLDNAVYGFKGELPDDLTFRDGTTLIYPHAFQSGFTYDFVDNQFVSVRKSFTSSSVTIPDSVKRIGAYAFAHGSLLTEVTIGDGVEVIGDSAFNFCRYLDKLTVGSGVRQCGSNIFSSCWNLTQVELKYGIQEIGDSMFSGCYRLEDIQIPASVKRIGSRAFLYCYSIEKFKIPDSVTYIGTRAFEDTQWYEDQPDGIVYAGRVAYGLKGDAPEELVFANGTVSFTNSDFWLIGFYHPLKRVVLPEGLGLLGSHTLSHSCFESIVVPSGVVNMSDYAFSGNLLYVKNKPTIYGYTGSAAEKFADKFEVPFIAIGVEAHDDATGVEVGVKDGVSLTAADITDSSRALRLPHSGTLLSAYEISLSQDGEEVQPEAVTSIKIPTDNPNAKVYRVDNGVYRDMRAVYQDGYLIFAADRCGVYVLAQTADEEPYFIGDADGNGEVEAIDITLIQRHNILMNTGIDENILMHGDIDGNGMLEIIDATYIQRWLAHQALDYPIGEAV